MRCGPSVVSVQVSLPTLSLSSDPSSEVRMGRSLTGLGRLPERRPSEVLFPRAAAADALRVLCSLCAELGRAAHDGGRGSWRCCQPVRS